MLLESCDTKDKQAAAPTPAAVNEDDRMAEEKVILKKLREETFFTPEEMATITILADIIVPKDDVSGSASDAKVPEFIEFIVKDMPDHKVPMRGGLRWMDNTCLKRHEKAFKDCTKEQQLKLVDEIAATIILQEYMRQI